MSTTSTTLSRAPTAAATVTPIFPGGNNNTCPVCPTCFTCQNQGCLNYGECKGASCVCPEGFAGQDCGLAACNSTNVPTTLRGARPDRSECQCDTGFAGINCNACYTDAACQSTNNVDPSVRVDGVPRVCNRTPRLYSNSQHHMACRVTSQEIVGVFPDLMEATLSRSLDSASGVAAIWYKKVLQFTCKYSQCTSSIQPAAADGSAPASDVWTCPQIECKCVSSRVEMCGTGTLNVAGALQSLPGPFKLTCPLSATSSAATGNTSIAAVSESTINGNAVRTWTGGSGCVFKLGGGLDALVPNGVQLQNCLMGQCAYQRDAPLNFNGPQSLLSGFTTAEISGMAIVGVMLLGLLTALFIGKRQRDSFLRVPVPPPAPGMTYQVKSLTYVVGEKSILSNVAATFPVGTLTAVMGPSGAGKSSFLDIAAHKPKRGTIDADFDLDGTPIKFGHKGFRHAIGYVDQEDVLLPWLTVEETLWFVAQTRLPEAMSNSERQRVIDAVLKDLNIEHIRATRIGGAGHFRGISGGEKRRVSIATELVTQPSILFLDEPSSGLDSYNAHKLLETLSQLARRQSKTIVCTIHQPRSDMYALFDQILLLARGSVLYHGPAADAKDYFTRGGRPCPPDYNVADHLLDVAIDENTPPMPEAEREQVMAAAVSRAKRTSRTRALSDDLTFPVPDSPSIHQMEPPSSPTATIRRGNTMVWTVPGWDAAAPGGGGDGSPEPAPQSPAGDSEDRRMRALLDHHEMQERSSLTSVGVAGKRTAAEQSSSTLSDTSGQATIVKQQAAVVIASSGTYRTAYLTQVMCLLGRNARCLVRNPRLLIGHNVLAVVLGVFIGGIYFQSPMTIAGLQNRLGSVFFVQSLIAFASLSALGGIADERLLFMRERGNASYKPSAYFISKMLLDLFPLRIVPTIIMSSIIYFMIGFQPILLNFAKYLLVLVLFSAISALFAMATGVLLWDTALANLASAISTLFFMLFGGVLINANAIPSGLRFLQWLSYFRWSTEALAVNECETLTVRDSFSGIKVAVSGQTILTSIFGYESGSYARDVLVLVGIDVLLLCVVGSLIAVKLREVR